MKFSEYFKLDKTQPYLDFVDIRLDTDIPVFLDPSAIKSLETTWGHELSYLLQSFFSAVLKRIKNGDHEEAQKLLSSLNEKNDFHLGYSRGKSRGHAFGAKTAESVWYALSNSKSAVTGLLKDLEDSCLLIEGIGIDMISDAVCNILRGPLLRYTKERCKYHNIKMEPQVPSGPIWNPKTEKWENHFVSLPVSKEYGKIVLVPKILVRHQLSYQCDDYYRHYLLPQMQLEELRAGSSLVEVLKNGKSRVTKKSLIKKYGSDKSDIVKQTVLRPAVLNQYKSDKDSNSLPPLTHNELSQVEGSTPPNWQDLIKELKSLPAGKKESYEYEDLIERIITSLFYPSLCNPVKQYHLHGGQKIVDIKYTNEAREGFFRYLSLHYSSAIIPVECKNYSEDLGNPEVDQLAGRFSPSRGVFGILMYRSITDKDRLVSRCIATAKDSRGFILPLDDQDLIEIMEHKASNPNCNEFPSLRKFFDKLIS
jgi:hypothetical protein